MHVYFLSLCLSEISTWLRCCYCKGGINTTVLMCCLHFPTVKKQPIISCNTVVTSVGTLLLGFQLMKYFPWYNYLSFFFFLLFSPFIFHPHANDWLNGHPCFWSFQEWATKMLTHILLDPVSQLWTPRSHFLTATPEWARELSLLYWGGIGAWSVTWSRESLAQDRERLWALCW